MKVVERWRWAPDSATRARRGACRLRRRAPAAVCTLLMVAFGMETSLFWIGLGGGSFSRWVTPADLWRLDRASNLLAHSHFGALYQHSGLVAFPGFEYLLAPVAALGHGLGLGVLPGSYFAIPTDWLLLGPFCLAISGVVLFAADAAAERLGAPLRRRWLLALGEAVAAANVVVHGGHPEDVVCVGLLVYAALAADRGRWSTCAWLCGGALALQPMALLAVPAIVARVDRKTLAGMVPMLVIPSAAVLAGPAIADWGRTVTVLLHQPATPTLNHATLWTHWAPRLPGKTPTVAGGPIRLVGLAVAMTAGGAVCRRHHRLETVLWMAAVGFALRVASESVVVGYYLWPVVALGLLAAAASGSRRLGATAALSLAATYLADRHTGWVLGWWSVALVLAVALLACAWPGRPAMAGSSAGSVVRRAVSGDGRRRLRRHLGPESPSAVGVVGRARLDEPWVAFLTTSHGEEPPWR